MSYDAGTVVIGAGVIGLAIARELSLRGDDVLVIEKNHTFGSETSSRHSEVIHAGIYYKTNSLKSQFCLRGKSLLYRYCENHAIDHKAIGKIIVATNQDQIKQLHSIALLAKKNGLNDLHFLDSKQVSDLEPAIIANAGLLSPSTGIIDSHGFMLSLLGEAQANGALIAYNCTVESIKPQQQGYVLRVGGEQELNLSCKRVINAAGHGAPLIASATHGLAQAFIPEARYAKGNYFQLKGASPVSRLIYPIPQDVGLGTHITIDLAGNARFGPDVEWIDAIDYDVDHSRADSFYAAIRQYWPALEDNALQADYAGIRPKLYMKQSIQDDFIIQGQKEHGFNGLLNLFGIESPGLTASLAIAEYAANHVLHDSPSYI